MLHSRKVNFHCACLPVSCPDQTEPSPGEDGSGLDTEGGILSVSTVTKTPGVFFWKTTTESEVAGELFTQRPTGVDITYTQSPSELPLPQPPSATEIITEVIEGVTARPDVGRGRNKMFVISPTGQ